MGAPPPMPQGGGAVTKSLKDLPPGSPLASKFLGPGMRRRPAAGQTAFFVGPATRPASNPRACAVLGRARYQRRRSPSVPVAPSGGEASPLRHHPLSLTGHVQGHRRPALRSRPTSPPSVSSSRGLLPARKESRRQRVSPSSLLRAPVLRPDLATSLASGRRPRGSQQKRSRPWWASPSECP